MKENYERILESARELRWEIGGDFHEKIMEALYTDATRIADRAVIYPDEKPRFDLDRTIDRLVTSRVWGFPLMILMLTLVFWLTISGANLPSGLLYTLLIDKVHPLLKAAAA
ncbi:MAG: ferrous iron transporter B, partial [Anaerolineales bacterium]